MAKSSVYLCSLYVLLLTSYSMAMTEEQRSMIKTHFEAAGMECFKDNHISEEDISALRSHKLPSGPDVPCFLACVFKKTGIIDEQGMLQKETILEMAKKVFTGADEMKLIEDYVHSCWHINTVAVSDGEKGCERAMLAHKCMLDNAAQFGFDI